MARSKPINDVAFAPDGRWIVTSSSDNKAHVWDVASGREIMILRGHTAPVVSAAFSRDGKYVVTAGADGTAHVYLVHIEDLISLARSRVTRNLKCEERQLYLHEPPLPNANFYTNIDSDSDATANTKAITCPIQTGINARKTTDKSEFNGRLLVGLSV